jgi:hypothetical protein|tara:strand:+ start:716 stop:1396 length:681 start_codon:yes stop_codon:yes gene_type:complete
MALATYSDLKTSIANWLNRSDLTSEISEDFIVLTEKDFNSKLRIRKMNATDSSFTIDSETKALPTGFLQIRDFYILQGGTKYALRYITPAQMDQIKGSSTTGLPVTFTILGDNFRFAPSPDSSYTGVVNYYKEFDPLSDSNTSNYILSNHPAIYLYGSLYHAANFLGGIEPRQVQQWQQMYSTALERLERNDREDQYGNAPLQQTGDVTVSGAFNDVSRIITSNNN